MGTGAPTTGCDPEDLGEGQKDDKGSEAQAGQAEPPKRRPHQVDYKGSRPARSEMPSDWVTLILDQLIGMEERINSAMNMRFDQLDDRVKVIEEQIVKLGGKVSPNEGDEIKDDMRTYGDFNWDAAFDAELTRSGLQEKEVDTGLQEKEAMNLEKEAVLIDDETPIGASITLEDVVPAPSCHDDTPLLPHGIEPGSNIDDAVTAPVDVDHSTSHITALDDPPVTHDRDSVLADDTTECTPAPAASDAICDTDDLDISVVEPPQKKPR